MARFGVLDHNQRETDNPKEFYPKSIALQMLRRQQADRLGPRLIRRRPHGSQTLKAEIPVDNSPRAAGKLPPREVGGCFFQQPQSDSWRIQHKTVHTGRFEW